jgi:hypothetical protein
MARLRSYCVGHDCRRGDIWYVVLKKPFQVIFLLENLGAKHILLRKTCTQKTENMNGCIKRTKIEGNRLIASLNISEIGDYTLYLGQTDPQHITLGVDIRIVHRKTVQHVGGKQHRSSSFASDEKIVLIDVVKYGFNVVALNVRRDTRTSTDFSEPDYEGETPQIMNSTDQSVLTDDLASWDIGEGPNTLIEGVSNGALHNGNHERASSVMSPYLLDECNEDYHPLGFDEITSVPSRKRLRLINDCRTETRDGVFPPQVYDRVALLEVAVMRLDEDTPAEEESL